MPTAGEPPRSIGLTDIVVRGDLRRLDDNGLVRPFQPTAFDQNLLRVADAAVARQLPTGLVLPVPGTNIGVLLASAVVIAKFARTRQATEVGLVTKQLHLRAFYDRLYIGRDTRLADSFPRTIVAADGIVSDVRPRSQNSVPTFGRLHFVTDLSRVSAIRYSHAPGRGGLDGLVIESQAAQHEDVRRVIAELAGKVPILYLTVDPYDSVLSEIEAVGAVWAWDSCAMAALTSEGAGVDTICAGPALLRDAGATAFEVGGPKEDSKLDGILARLWDDLAEIQYYPGGLTLDTVGWVWGVFGALSQLVVPVTSYDRYARTAWGTTAISDANLKANAFARHAVLPEHREYWEILAEDLDDAVQAAVRANAKADLLVAWVRNQVIEKNPGLVAVKNMPARVATIAYLQERADVPFDWERYVEVTTFQELATGRKRIRVPSVLFAGPVVSRFACLLALPTTARLTVLAHGSWEAGRIARQIEGAASRLSALAHGHAREAAVGKLFGGTDIGPFCNPVPPKLVNTVSDVPWTCAKPKSAVWDPFDVQIARSLARHDDDAEGPGQRTTEGMRSQVSTLSIEFDDGIGFFEPGCVLSKVEDGELREVAIKSLALGDRIVLVDRGARRDLFDLVVEKLEDMPEYTATALLVHEWHRRARQAGIHSGLTYDEILRRMNGTTITSAATIGTWVRAAVHGPSNPEDIRRFGKAVDDEFLANRWEPISRALSTMRNHRRKIGHMLARALTGISSNDLEDQGYFDRRLGIHFSDFTDTISDHVVRGVSTLLTTVPYQYANRLLSREEAARFASGKESGHDGR